MGARLIQVIETDESRGKGVDHADPYRRIIQYFTTDGELLAEVDSFLCGNGNGLHGTYLKFLKAQELAKAAKELLEFFNPDGGFLGGGSGKVHRLKTALKNWEET